MSDMKTEQLQSGQGALELGATHGENTGFGEPRDLRPDDVRQMFGPGQTPIQRFEAARMVDMDRNKLEMGGGFDEDKAKKEFTRRWTRGVIGLGPDVLTTMIADVETRIRRGETLGVDQKIALRDRGGSVQEQTVTLGEYFNALRLAQAVYLPPAEAARRLRTTEGLAQKAIDDFQLNEGLGAGSAEYARRSDGRSLSNKDWAAHLETIQKTIENPPELEVFRKRLEALKNEYGPESLTRMAERFRRHQIVCLMPDTKDLPPFTPFDRAIEEIRRRMPDGKDVDPETYRLFLAEQDMMKRAEMAKSMGLGMSQEAMGGEYYIGMYQKAWDEFCEALNTFPPEIQDEIVANYIVGGSMLGSQFASFYRKGLEQRGRYPSRWTPWLNAADLFGKISQIEGYIPPEHIFQSLGSVKPEVLAFPDYHHSNHEVWLAGEDEPRRFSLSSRDMIGQLGKIDTLARMGVNNAYTSETGFFAVRNGEFAEYVFRQMGFSPEEARNIAYGKIEPPTLIRDRWLSPVRRGEVTDIWDWIGETALDKLIVPMAWLKYSRADLEFVPLDIKRRTILSMRGLELAHYRIGYSIGLPPEQFLNMIALFGSAISLDHKDMLSWVGERLAKSSDSQETAKTREAVWDETITLKRPSLASSRHLARMAMGIGKYDKRRDDYRVALKDGMSKLPSSYVEAIRHPDYWKWRWFKNADRNSSDWEYIGDVGGGVSKDRMKEVFAGHDFTEELRACGLSENEIKKLPRIGFDGWKSLLANATLGLLEWEKMGYTTGDKTNRYEAKKEKTQDATIAFWETSNPNVPDSLDDMLIIDSEVGQLADIQGKTATYQRIRRKTEGLDDDLLISGGVTQAITEAFSKILEPISGSLGFVLNSTQQAYLESVIWTYMEGHCAQRLDVLVEDIDVKKDKFVGGVNWSVPVLTRSDLEKFPDRVEALESEGFYFVHMADTEASKDVLVSPLAAPVPRLIKAVDLLNKTSSSLERADGKIKDHASHIIDAIGLMKREGAFCWDTLINGRADIPPATIISAINEVKEEGAMTAAGKRAICNEALRFYKIHPHGPSAITDKTTKIFVPKLIK